MPQLAEEPLDVCLLIDARDSRIDEQREQMIPLEENRRTAAVSETIVVLVMILIVCRYPGNCRMAIVNRDEVAGQQVRRPHFPDREMVVVVTDHRDAERHEQVKRVNGRMEPGEVPLENRQEHGEEEIGDRAAICRVAQHQYVSVFAATVKAAG